MSGNEISLKEAIQQLIKQYRLRGKLSQNKLSHQWEQIMGKTIASRTKNVYLTKGKLIIELNSSVLRNELSFLKNKIIAKVNEELGEEVVKEVVLK